MHVYKYVYIVYSVMYLEPYIYAYMEFERI